VKSVSSEAPRVTVIVPTRNRRDYLEESLTSVRRQSLENWEIIVIDDASDDGTWDWIRGQADDRLRCRRMEANRGSTITRNLGVQLARGEYCLFLDDDDRLPVDALQVHVDALDARREAIATLGCVAHMNAAGTMTGGRLRPTPVRMLQRDIWRQIHFWWTFLVGASLFRTSALREVGGFDESIVFYGDDVDLWLRIGLLGPVVLMPEVVLEYRSHGGQARPDDYLGMLNSLGRRHAEAAPPGRRKTIDRIHRARQALADLRIGSGHSGNLMRIARLMRTTAVCPYLLTSPLSLGDIVRAVRRDLRLDPWLRWFRRSPEKD